MKYGCIQVLSGGIALGAEKAFGKRPDWLISYKGLENANERWLLEYYLKRDKSVPPYFTWNKEMYDLSNNVSYIANNYYGCNKSNIELESEIKEKYKDTDVVVALPVCSGLSTSQTSKDKNKVGATAVQNNNMKFITNFVLSEIKPKVFIFENAPTLYGNRGNDVRQILNEYANKNNYCVQYILTNSNLHNNVQHRKRTFVIFWQNVSNINLPPKINFYNNTCNSVINFLSNIPTNANHNDVINDDCGQKHILQSPLYKYMFEKYGKNYRSILINNKENTIGAYIVKYEFDECLKWLVKNNYNKRFDILNRWKKKIDMGLGFWDDSPHYLGDSKTCTCFHKTTMRLIHPLNERGFTIREWLHIMGHPSDFDIPKEEKCFWKTIGQNCPVQTICDWCTEIKKVIEDWDIKRINYADSNYFNNIKQEDLCPIKKNQIQKIS